MKILHLFSDLHKTGPVEPTLLLCRKLVDRGHEVLFAYRAGSKTGRLDKAVEASGVPGTTRFALNRYLNPIDTIRDMRDLPRFIREQRLDIVHTHLRHDQVLGGWAAKRARRLQPGGRPRIVHSLHRRLVLKDNFAYRWLLRRFADGLLAFTPGFRQAYIDRFGLDPDRVGVMPMLLDMSRFDPGGRYEDMRAKWGVPGAGEAVLIGIVGRFQRYRKMDLFLEAARRVVAQQPSVRFVVIGRSRSMEQTVRRPVRELGLSDHVVLAGYLKDDYAAGLAALDVFTLLMPGSDGTARAVREAMAMGKPCVVSRFGMLPEIVGEGRCGLVTEMNPDDLAAAWLTLARDTSLRMALGRAARQDALTRFDPDRAATEVEGFYQRMLMIADCGLRIAE